MHLRRAESEQILVSRLQVAKSFWARTKGLLGRETLGPQEALWILRCNSVHTFFMKFAIDLVFVNRRLEVVKTLAHVQPGRLVWPVWRASSVIELRDGFLKSNPIKPGDKLHVDRTLS